MAAQLLGLILISFVVISIFMVPYINLLFSLKRKLEHESEDVASSDVPITDKLMKGDEMTPSGGGVLLLVIIVLLTVLFALFSKTADIPTVRVLLFSLLGFGAVGLVDDIHWLTTIRKGKIKGLGRKMLFLMQLVVGLFIGWLLYSQMGISNIYVPVLGNLVIGAWYIPVAALIIVSFSNAFNISDGLDGLSTGLLVINLFAFLALASAVLNPTLGSFIGIWIGTLFAYLYFNIWPARIFLGDAGAFAFGATLAVVGLLTGKIVGLAVIGGVYVIIVGSSLLQILSKKFLHRKIIPVAPIHMYFKYIGWPEPKIVARFWLAGAIFAIFGLWLALVTK